MSRRQLVAALFARKKGVLKAFIARRTRAPADIADLVQEAYLRMLRAGETPIDDPERYLLAVASNLVKEHALLSYRREKREILTDPLELPETAEEIDYADDQDREETHARLRRIVGQLPGRYQLVLSLTYEEGLSQAEIAERLNVSRSMVQKILTKSHAHCRARLLNRRDP
jgi:RNA polymerase sigma factor (sigma-70 family)